ncbi:MAG: hypothetical protein R3Y04_02165 [Rikenellaceae bacterium]
MNKRQYISFLLSLIFIFTSIARPLMGIECGCEDGCCEIMHEESCCGGHSHNDDSSLSFSTARCCDINMMDDYVSITTSDTRSSIQKRQLVNTSNSLCYTPLNSSTNRVTYRQIKHIHQYSHFYSEWIVTSCSLRAPPALV